MDDKPLLGTARYYCGCWPVMRDGFYWEPQSGGRYGVFATAEQAAKCGRLLLAGLTPEEATVRAQKT